ncbi:MAG: potassium channel family protein [Chloroflexota bacterium]
MRIIVMGCGRVGEQVSRRLAGEGHDLAVIDKDPHALENLGPDFKGRRVAGVGFDRDVLIRAGIEQADAFAATSASDNANVIAARIARHIFHVPRVVARLYDPRRAEIYNRLGLQTISATELGAQRILEMLSHAELDPVFTFGAGEVCLITIEAPARLVGLPVRHLVVPGEISVTAITRQGSALIPFSGSEFRAGDLVHLTLLTGSLDRFKRMLGLVEGE